MAASNVFAAVDESLVVVENKCTPINMTKEENDLIKFCNSKFCIVYYILYYTERGLYKHQMAKSFFKNNGGLLFMRPL